MDTSKIILDKMYTVQEVADFLEVHKLTVYNWLELHRISYFKMSERKTLISGKELLDFLKRSEVKAIKH